MNCTVYCFRSIMPIIIASISARCLKHNMGIFKRGKIEEHRRTSCRISSSKIYHATKAEYLIYAFFLFLSLFFFFFLNPRKKLAILHHVRTMIRTINWRVKIDKSLQETLMETAWRWEIGVLDTHQSSEEPQRWTRLYEPRARERRHQAIRVARR